MLFLKLFLSVVKENNGIEPALIQCDSTIIIIITKQLVSLVAIKMTAISQVLILFYSFHLMLSQNIICVHYILVCNLNSI